MSVNDPSQESSVLEFGSGQEQPPPPVRFEIVPDELFALVNLHDMRQGENAFSCWSYVSEGLSRYGQKELAILVKQESAEGIQDYPMDPLGLFLTVRQYAEQGNFVVEGDVTEFGETGFISDKFRAMAYVRPLGIAGLDEPNGLLSCVLLTEDELDVARRFGLTRVLSLLGYTHSHFPCPPWADRARKSVVDGTMRAGMDASILAKVPQFTIPGVRVQLAGTQLTIRCPNGIKDGLRELLKQIPEEAPLTISTELDPDANALLVWQPTMDNGPSAITPPGSDGSKVCGCAVMLFPEQDESNAQVLEDSFLLGLTTPDWIKLRNGFMTGVDAHVMTPQGGKIKIEWYEPEPTTQIVGPGGVPTLPLVELPESAATVTEVALVSEEEKVMRSINPIVLRQFVEAVEFTALGYFVDRKATEPRVITIECDLEQGRKVKWRMSSTPDEDKIELKGIELRLAELPIPDVTGDTVTFKFVLNVKPEKREKFSP